MMRRVQATLGVAFVALVCSAHVGSPTVWFTGEAGPYPVRVIVRPPEVVPGLADIIVRAPAGVRVFVTPSRWDTGTEGAPPPDEALPVRAQPDTYTAQLWLMARGAYRIAVTIEGADGTGVVVVPVDAVATSRLEMSQATSVGLILGGLFLFAGLLTIVHAGTREGVLAPGEQPDAARRRRARLASAGAALLVSLLLFGGWRWWSAVDSSARARLDRPWSSTTSVDAAPDGARALRFAITDSLWVMRSDADWLRRNNRYARPPLIPDHGKLMHMFLVREPAMDAFAHLHPVSSDSVRFDATLPALPAGRYSVYADIVLASGSVQTMVDTVDVPETGRSLVSGAPAPAADPDDAAWLGGAAGTLIAPVNEFSDGTRLELAIAGELVAEGELELAVRASRDGAPVALEPYMGMNGHAMIRRDDGAVFVHLHPLGTISTAAKRALEAAVTDGRNGQSMDHAGHGESADPGVVTFPYAFPQAGSYRIWVQVRIDGVVRTGAWDVRVEAPAS